MFTIEPPKNCPACDSVLIWVNDAIYCKNTQCSAKLEKRIEHFAKTLKIKGLGPSTISNLSFTSINEIYETPRKDIVERLSSTALGNKLVDEIEKSKSAPMNILLAAFSIPLIGTTLSERLAATCDSVYDITEKTCIEAGLGPKATENLLSWLELDFPLVRDLPFDFKFHRKASNKQKKGVVCISGKLNSFKTKAEATSVLEAAGYEVKSSITKDVTILVNEGGVESSKTIKARESGIQVITNIKSLLEI